MIILQIRNDDSEYIFGLRVLCKNVTFIAMDILVYLSIHERFVELVLFYTKMSFGFNVGSSNNAIIFLNTIYIVHWYYLCNIA